MLVKEKSEAKNILALMDSVPFSFIKNDFSSSFSGVIPKWASSRISLLKKGGNYYELLWKL
jgi:hypothetical protein